MDMKALKTPNRRDVGKRPSLVWAQWNNVPVE